MLKILPLPEIKLKRESNNFQDKMNIYEITIGAMVTIAFPFVSVLVIAVFLDSFAVKILLILMILFLIEYLAYYLYLKDYIAQQYKIEKGKNSDTDLIIGENMFNSDKPISNENEDKLNRMPFVKKLSKSICCHNSQDCLVIGLMGEWGSGKTSILNLTFSEIKKEKDNWIFIDFNPWYFSNQDNLILQFFNKLLNELKSSDNFKKKAEDIFFKFMKGISINVNLTVLSLNLDLDKVLKQEEFRKFNSLKEDLFDIFSELDYKIIISIDNIDRLTNDEIQQIFLLVKSLADFPNIIYILPFDRNIILTSIESIQNGFREEYLDKIIQLQIDLPKIPKYKLKEIFKKELKKLIQNENIDLKNEKGNLKSENRDLWSILDFLTTIRAVNRYINNLNFYLPLMKNKLNPIDSIILIGLQLFENKIYHEIKNNKEFFTIKLIDKDVETNHNNLHKHLQEILNKKENLSKERLTQILTELFPQLINLDNTKNLVVGYDGMWNSQLRICSYKVFNKYFELTISESNIISNSHFETIIQSENYDFIKKEVLQNDENGKSEDFLIKLKDNAHKIDSKNIKLFFRLLYDIGNGLDVEKNGSILFSKNSLLLINIRSLAKQLNNEKLYEAMEYGIKNAKECLDLLVADLSSHDKNNQKVQEEKKLTDEQLDALKKQACIKIKNWADEGKLFNVYKPSKVLYEWYFWDNEECTNFIDKTINDDAKIINLLRIFSSVTNGIAKFDFKTIDKICPTDRINDQIKKINEKLEDESNEKFICESFIKEYETYETIKDMNR